MRYVWDFSGEYFNLMRFAFWPVLSYLKAWDKKTSLGPNFYFTISHTVADRVKRYYNRDSIVIYPPVDTEFFVPKNAGKDYYLIVSALVPYKRIDLAVSAFTKMGLSLKIIGAGTDYNKLKKKAGPNIEFLGWQDNNTVRDYYAGCKAFIFPGVEDFGITVLEAQGCGRPVIAYFGGGARETINPDIPTGVFFREQTVESLENAVYEFEKNKNAFDKDKIRNHVLKFERELFKKRLTDEIQRLHSLYYNR
jgi:glycosyltransferase involved in cell wall biosynthesis